VTPERGVSESVRTEIKIEIREKNQRISNKWKRTTARQLVRREFTMARWRREKRNRPETADTLKKREKRGANL